MFSIYSLYGVYFGHEEMLTAEEEKILESIHVASYNDPYAPEFPAKDPKFPATPTYKITIGDFSNIRLKDESFNPTGTHKDRLAREIVVTYRHFLLAKKRGQIQGPLVQMSIISSGSAAVAVQTLLSEYGLPNLKVLMDHKSDKKYLKKVEKLGGETYLTDLSKKELNSQEILQLTNNENGFDITSGVGLDPTQRFYDRLSYEIINESPDYCFIPYGTGNLYENILNVNKQEIQHSGSGDPRFQGDTELLSQCNFIGATTNNPSTLAQKLYSPHLPFANASEQWLRFFKYSGFCGNHSGIHVVKEKYLHDAIAIAKQEKISAEPSGLAGLAMFLQMKNNVPKDVKVLIVNTGLTKI